MRIILPALFATALITSLPAIAQGPDDGYLDLVPYFTRVDRDRNTEPQAGGIRGAYGWGWSGPWYSEVQVFGAILETEDLGGDMDFYMSGLGFDVAYNFGDRRGYTPYLLGGLGAVYDDVQPDSDDTTSAFINLAAGITTQEITRRGIRLRAEVRYMHDYFKDGMNDWQFGLGISIPLRCPTTVAMAPAPAYVEPAPVEVHFADSDNDGVMDKDDRCPDTLPGAQVDSEGCVLANQTVTLEDIHFEFNSAKLTPGARNSLERVVRALRSQPGSNVEIAGHTDNRGNDAYNLKLSRERAQSVRSFLVSQGISADRLAAQGYGETQPVGSNSTELGRAQNRRVEIRFR
jgi:OOP family OmpA-OmpF porin